MTSTFNAAALAPSKGRGAPISRAMRRPSAPRGCAVEEISLELRPNSFRGACSLFGYGKRLRGKVRESCDRFGQEVVLFLMVLYLDPLLRTRSWLCSEQASSSKLLVRHE